MRSSFKEVTNNGVFSACITDNQSFIFNAGFVCRKKLFFPLFIINKRTFVAQKSINTFHKCVLDVHLTSISVSAFSQFSKKVKSLCPNVYFYLFTLSYHNGLNIYDFIFIHMCSCNFSSLPVLGKETKHSITIHISRPWLRENPGCKSTDFPRQPALLSGVMT